MKVKDVVLLIKTLDLLKIYKIPIFFFFFFYRDFNMSSW